LKSVEILKRYLF